MSEEQAEYKFNRQTGTQFKLRATALLEYPHANYTPPNKNEVREVLRRGQLTGAVAGDLVGVTDRTIRKWTGTDQKMSYASWRLLLIHIGMVRVEIHPNGATQER